MTCTDNIAHQTTQCNIVFMQSRADQARAEAAYTRRVIRKADLTRAQKDILTGIVNLWYRHRSGPKGYIHPGREALAKRARTSIITAARALDVFRDLGLITPIRYASGGPGCATQYTVNIARIWAKFDPDGVEIRAGNLVEMVAQSVSNDTVGNGQNDTVDAYQNDTLSYMNYGCVFNDSLAKEKRNPIGGGGAS